VFSFSSSQFTNLTTVRLQKRTAVMCARLSVLAQLYINDHNGRQFHISNKTWYNLCRAFIGPGGDQCVARFKKYQVIFLRFRIDGVQSILEDLRSWWHQNSEQINYRAWQSVIFEYQAVFEWKRGRVHVWPPRSPDLTLKLFFCILSCCVRWRLQGKYLKK
jgi:hypothetical protein